MASRASAFIRSMLSTRNQAWMASSQPLGLLVAAGDLDQIFGGVGGGGVRGLAGGEARGQGERQERSGPERESISHNPGLPWKIGRRVARGRARTLAL